MLANLLQGFDVVLTVSTLFACFIGALMGTFIGVLPGIGTLAGMSLLLPLTFTQTPVDAIVMLSGIYFGTMYGGSTAAILLNLPGSEPSAVVCLDGYPMSQQGRAGVALTLTTLASFVGGCSAILLVMAFAKPLVSVALSFSSVEYFSLILLALIASSTIAASSITRSLVMIIFGLLIGLVGIEVQTGYPRFTFGSESLLDGVSMVVVALGLFGVTEILWKFADGGDTRRSPSIDVSWRSMIPTRQDWREAARPIGRGTGLGSLIGILPGAGAAISSFVAYAVEKKISKNPSKFGKGAVEGISSAEAANNAAAQAAFIPTLALGIPGSATMALILGTLMIHGIQPGPRVISNNPDLFWGVIAGFWVGNVILIFLNLPLIGLWIRLLKVPYTILYQIILFFICFGAYSVSRNVFDVLLCIGFGFVGYCARRMDLPAAPVLLGMVLGPMAEEHLRRALLLGRGDYTIFLTSPVSLVCLVLALGTVALSIYQAHKHRRMQLKTQ
ncbi:MULTISPECIES: tripartite tricarboxylate transporter permease [Mameliella]|uniref:Tricarboxylate transport protein TctA n=1 Tax=Mameliella alba TaxID=561184 RepID=A0A0B3RZS6_9RHOB|nr:MULTISPECIES: tripartite tricarboxylate transporter permease [Mameliella]MCR9275540.1 tripartite tricarboxylate transporter permease [Paracoccaceae bacterium]ODM47456.1 hypothetical protein A9320_22605 [Ruegeria sp. PBVC088]KHQ49766.1 Tricarboxylate transport protein TctA [Mameliella alba]MBY6122319.1 tripartite tricarboxylate transporter permease [Mameliella alba]MDD9731016.1 tripartite tricarboxylate transporter permease [Mameliella sp. AT18]